MGGGSPINNKANLDDELDFEREILDATSQSFLNQTGILETSRMEQPSTRPPPPSNQQLNSSQMLNQSVLSQRPPPAAPQNKPLSFQEQIALASQNLKKDAPP